MLNRQQQKAFEQIVEYVKGRDQFFILCGYAGTGKSFLLQHVVGQNILCAYQIALSAPTNKAAKVLRKIVPSVEIKCCTIYSLLGIKMVSDEDRLVLELPKRFPVLGQYKLIVVDEASCVNKVLLSFIKEVAAANPHIKWLFVGDPAQLPPVGERFSAIWKEEWQRAVLTTVERNDNQLLVLATHVRKQISRCPKHNLILSSDHDADRGVWKYNNTRGFINGIYAATDKGLFVKEDCLKIIAWRNKTVEDYNKIVRERIFGFNVERYVVGDRVMVAAPVERGGRILANIDDEGTLSSVDVVHHSVFKEFMIYRVMINMDGKGFMELNIVHESSHDQLLIKLNSLAIEAKADRSKWKYFWALNNSFDKIRYGYAMTVHRSQGSTFQNVFLCCSDVLSSSNKKEALKCLYVGVTRPTTKLIMV